MSKTLEILELIKNRGDLDFLEDALRFTAAIEALYHVETPESWALANVDQYRADRKITFIKDIRAAVPNTGLLEAKMAAEAAIQEFSLQALKDKLSNPVAQRYDGWGNPVMDPWDNEEPPF